MNRRAQDGAASALAVPCAACPRGAGAGAGAFKRAEAEVGRVLDAVRGGSGGLRGRQSVRPWLTHYPARVQRTEPVAPVASNAAAEAPEGGGFACALLVHEVQSH